MPVSGTKVAAHTSWEFDQVCGEHFNKTGHSQLDMLPIILEEVTPENDDFLRLKREGLRIRNYQSVEFGANKHSSTFLYTFCYLVTV